MSGGEAERRNDGNSNGKTGMGFEWYRDESRQNRLSCTAAFRGIGTGVISRRLQYGELAAQYSTTVVEVGCATVGRFKTIDASALPSWEQQTMDPVREADN